MAGSTTAVHAAVNRDHAGSSPAPSARRIAELERCRAVLTRPHAYCPHRPHPQQQKFLALDCLEALYGGAAGGGKSDALLMAALQYVHVPGYSALLFRRTYQDLALPGAIMDRSHEWLGDTDAVWNGSEKRWTFPSGATLQFGYLDTERDKFRYASAEFQFIGWDELTTFPERPYLFLFSRLRKRTGVDIPLRMRAATNPGGIGHDWVKARFIDAPGAPPFIPAKLVDNPSADAASYLQALANVDATTRQQLLDGMWVRDSGGLVYPFEEALNVIDDAPTDRITKASLLTSHVLGIDYGFTDATAFAVLGWRAHDPCVYVLAAYKQDGLTPSNAAEETKALVKEYQPDHVVGDTSGLGKGYAEEAIQRHYLPIEAAEKANKRGYQKLFAGALRDGNVRVVRATCDQLLDEWKRLPWTEDGSRESDGFDNHCADAVLYAWRTALAHFAVPEEVKPDEGTAEWEERAREQRVRDAARSRKAAGRGVLDWKPGWRR